jgi:predicted nucleotidyltransferase component of viral defense system
MKKEDFSRWVNLAMESADVAHMRPVVEKELLHYEIFYALDEAGLLKNLVFQGGTCLRLCRGSDRFSEDLDFAGGRDFSARSMERIKECIEKSVGARYGLKVTVKTPKPPKADSTVTVDTWWIDIETAPENPAMPRQKIKLEIANVPAYTREMVPLRINYEVMQGMPSVLVNVESMSEILADKIVAFPTSVSRVVNGKAVLTPQKIRHRDIWDIAWLIGKGARLDPAMVNNKIRDYGVEHYGKLLDVALSELASVVAGDAFKKQMQRFIDAGTYKQTLGREGYEAYLVAAVRGPLQEMQGNLAANPG